MEQNQNPEAPKTEAAPAPKLVKVKVLRDVMINGQIFSPVRGKDVIVECTEEEAKRVCDWKAKGYHPCYGYIPEIGPLMEGAPDPLKRKDIARAVRVA